VTATLQYAPPEILAGESPSAVSDLYSLGATLVELATGTAAFAQGRDEPPAALIARILNEPPADLGPHHLPDDLAGVLRSTLAKDPARRPSSARRLTDELAAVARAHHLDVTDEGPGPPTTTTAAPGPGEPATVAARTVGHSGSHQPTQPTPTARFLPSHLVPAQGLAAWTTPDGRYPPTAVMDPALPVQLLRWWGDWAEVRCSNGWIAWVNGRELVPQYS
jgi:serine/threonine protein kinase